MDSKLPVDSLLEHEMEFDSILPASKISFASESIAHQILRQGLESAISKHFVEKYYGLIINPESHLAFYNDWIVDIQKLMMDSKSLQYSVLANAATHLHFMDESAPMQELAMGYYWLSIQSLRQTLASGKRIKDDNSILMSIMLLYLHGVGASEICFTLVYFVVDH
jgi:hypothetical protein